MIEKLRKNSLLFDGQERLISFSSLDHNDNDNDKEQRQQLQSIIRIDFALFIIRHTERRPVSLSERDEKKTRTLTLKKMMNNRMSAEDMDDGKQTIFRSSCFKTYFLEGNKDDGEVREQDRFLPVANIARIMKTVLPPNAKIAKDAKETIQECVSEFISFITSEASDKCLQEKRKTINGDDLLWAMSTLGFDRYIDPLKIYLGKYRDAVKGDKPEKKQGKKSEGKIIISNEIERSLSHMIDDPGYMEALEDSDGYMPSHRKRDLNYEDEAMPKKPKY